MPYKTVNFHGKKVTKGFLALFMNNIIRNVATGLFGIFIPIYFYLTFDKQVSYVVLYYLLNSFIYLYAVAFGARFLNKIGFRRSLQWSTFFISFFYILLFLLNRDNVLIIIPLMIITLSFWRILYWVPYHVDFSKFTKKKNKGEAVGAMTATLSLISVVTPIIAGFLIEEIGYDKLFIFGVFLYILSAIPYRKLPRTREVFDWSYKETWRRFFSKKHRKTVFAFMASGAETIIGMAIWPIFIYELLNGDFVKIGTISTLVVSVAVILELLVGKYTDKKGMGDKFLKYGAVFYSIGWLLKVFVETIFQVFMSDAFHRIANIFTKVPFDTMTYEIAAEKGHFIDEFTVIHEMAISAGRVVMLFIVLILLCFTTSLNIIFIFAAFASMFLGFIRYKDTFSKKRIKKVFL